ncbi:hypothetical protein ZOSMA_234G00090 [Zostera marina]|uniref:Gag1-like clamp domain-containing protein n=1 Tax=Zostera marina TaxID=29655 RepID=A0A0K9PK89_ZOSMR|nr:hypothetical protein ZOSMA_234G00090 [Zostera marina]
MHGSSSCLGCCTKSTPIIAVDEPTNGLKIQGRSVEKPGISDDFWSTSTHEMDNSGVQSMRSISSISTSVQGHDQHALANTSNPLEFVNHGLLLWNQNRQQWTGNKKTDSHKTNKCEPKISWNSTYESLLLNNKPFRQPIPLSEMIEFLVDAWEQEGMYD